MFGNEDLPDVEVELNCNDGCLKVELSKLRGSVTFDTLAQFADLKVPNTSINLSELRPTITVPILKRIIEWMSINQDDQKSRHELNPLTGEKIWFILSEAEIHLLSSFAQNNKMYIDVQLLASLTLEARYLQIDSLTLAETIMRMVSSFQPKKDTSEAFVLFDGQIIRNKMKIVEFFEKSLPLDIMRNIVSYFPLDQFFDTFEIALSTRYTIGNHHVEKHEFATLFNLDKEISIRLFCQPCLVYTKLIEQRLLEIVDINYAIYENAQDRYKAISWTYLENLPQGENRSLYFDYVNDVRLKKPVPMQTVEEMDYNEILNFLVEKRFNDWKKDLYLSKSGRFLHCAFEFEFLENLLRKSASPVKCSDTQRNNTSTYPAMQKPMRFLHTFEEIRSMIELPELRELVSEERQINDILKLWEDALSKGIVPYTNKDFPTEAIHWTHPFPLARITKSGEKVLGFFTKKFFLSNFHFLDEGFHWNGIFFNSNEKYYAFRKCVWFCCYEQAMKVLKENNPANAKNLANGRTLRSLHRSNQEKNPILFDSNIWSRYKIGVMWTGIDLKFSIPKYSTWLRSTADAHLMEASPTDLEWGIGFNLDEIEKMEIGEFGRNLLGKLLMLKRMQLRCVDLDQFAADLRKELYQEKSEINRKGPFQNKVEEKKEDLSLPKSVPNTSRVEFLPTSEQTENSLSKAQPLQKSAMQDSIQNDPNMNLSSKYQAEPHSNPILKFERQFSISVLSYATTSSNSPPPHLDQNYLNTYLEFLRSKRSSYSAMTKNEYLRLLRDSYDDDLGISYGLPYKPFFDLLLPTCLPYWGSAAKMAKENEDYYGNLKLKRHRRNINIHQVDPERNTYYVSWFQQLKGPHKCLVRQMDYFRQSIVRITNLDSSIEHLQSAAINMDKIIGWSQTIISYFSEDLNRNMLYGPIDSWFWTEAVNIRDQAIREFTDCLYNLVRSY